MKRTLLELQQAARDARAAWDARATLAVAVVVAAAIVPPVTGALGSLDTLAGGLYLAGAAVGLAFVVGVAGIPSLAQGAFFGVGAFVAAVLRIHLAWPLAPAVLLAGVVAGLAGFGVGAGVARLRPATIAVATLLLTWLGLLLLEAFPSAFGGAEGLAVPSALSARTHYEVSLALLVVAVVAFAALARSPDGLRLAALRGHTAAAVAAGVPAVRLRARAFAFAAVLAGFAGALAVDLAGVADPAAYDPALSFKLFAAVLIGGAASPLGGPAGIALLGIASLAVRSAAGASSEIAARFQTMFGALVVVLFLAAELDGVVPALARRLGHARPGVPDAASPVAARPRSVGLRAAGLSKGYGPVTALAGLDLELEPGTIRALIGPNGSGKTTALRALAGAVPLGGGSVTFGSEDVTAAPVERRVALGIVRTLQASAVFGALTALENVLVAVAGRCRYCGFGRTLAATPLHRSEARAARASALAALDAVGLRSRADARADALSATDQRLLMIATALGTDPRVLLLDEPSAGVGVAELSRLGDVLLELRRRGVALLVVEHNLRLVRAIADRVTVLDAGRPIAEGTPAEVWSDPRVRSVFLGRSAV